MDNPTAHMDGHDSDMAALSRLVAENARLREELAAAKDDVAAWKYEADCFRKNRDALSVELAAAQQDAARYRWLRSPVRGMGGLSSVINDDCNPPFYELKFGEGLDAAIDNAMKEQS